MSDQRIQEIKARVEAATPGEWEQANKSVRVVGTQIDYGCYKSAPTGRDGGICNCLGGGYQDGKNHPANIQAVKNAEFITHSKQDILWLIDQLESIQQEREDRIANPGEVSDGYHTFNELYHHRAVLFSVICNEHQDLAWKSLHHHKGGQPMYEGMFIVGINTPSGQATYHYDIDPYWDMFDVCAIDNSPEWDGHTPMQAIERIASLSREQEQQEPKPLGLQTIYFTPYSCEYCGDHLAIGWAFCPECGHQTKNKIAATEPKGEPKT